MKNSPRAAIRGADNIRNRRRSDFQKEYRPDMNASRARPRKDHPPGLAIRLKGRKKRRLRDAAENPANVDPLWRASTIANTVWFPRVLAILFVMSPALAMATLPPLAAMTLAGLAMSLLIARRQAPSAAESSVPVGNPFRLAPALKYGAIFTVILLAGKAAAATVGAGAVYWTSVIGGSFDVDAVAVTMCDLVRDGRAPLGVASAAVMLALASNAVLKTGLAFYAGTRAFGWRVGATFAVMLATGAVVWFVRF